ncbi:hypothetical protein L6164_001311 [Bauhinia variegata]|uniref:Uncharacterized protein n=1 Tax=Bauhinia variegata TaxID=167791 RepID=A0ACB9Q9D2_BAUVA|nr:hypothetical protein L6164_001311 [Bauhinia variegata]
MSRLHKPLNFFRVILPITIEEGKLPLPKGFGSKYGKTLSNMVLIKLPNGVKWKINWKMHDGQIWLENGWKEFVKFYAISIGYFLVFKYEGNSHFQVLIFDTSCLEIVYPVLHGTDDDEEGEKKIVEVIHDCNKTRSKSLVPCLRPNKKARTNPVVEPACSVPEMKAKSSRIGRKSRAKTATHLDINAAKKRFKGNGGSSFISGKRSKIETKRSKETFSFRKPFSFDVAMHPTYLTRSCLNFPRNHGMNYLSKNKGMVILQVSDGKTWPVSYKFSSHRGKFTNGWLSFVRANNLREGDICSFKMIESNGVSFMVSIKRAIEVSTASFSQGDWATNKPSSAFCE